jgi:predicted small metal-binding protein
VKEFDCGSVVVGCEVQFVADDEDEILAQVAEHARAEHGIDPPPPELVEQVRRHIRDRA